ncbi:hypothetical protein CHUAL_007685 [Chamberlinius hualienensis]
MIFANRMANDLKTLLNSNLDIHTICYVIESHHSYSDIEEVPLDTYENREDRDDACEESIDMKAKRPQFVEGFSSATDTTSEECEAYAADVIAKVKSLGKFGFIRRFELFCRLLHGSTEIICKMMSKLNRPSALYVAVTTFMVPQDICRFDDIWNALLV